MTILGSTDDPEQLNGMAFQNMALLHVAARHIASHIEIAQLAITLLKELWDSMWLELSRRSGQSCRKQHDQSQCAGSFAAIVW